MQGKKRYYDLNTDLRKRFGCRVQKITVDAGLSCPNRDGYISKGGCIFCSPKGSGTGAKAKGLSITEQIEQGKIGMIIRYKAKKFLIYFQSFTNTYGCFENLKSLYDEALSVKDVIGLSIGTRPDCVDKAILDLFESYAKNYLIWLEYGLQSIHDKTLTLINRGHNFKCFEQAVQMTQNRGIKICAHIILGLPGETKKAMLETAKKISQMDIDGLKIHLLYVIKNTKLAQMYYNGQYKALEQDQYVDIICDFLELLPPNMVIQRVTGDPHENEFVSPDWAFQKNETIKMINGTLEQRGTWQGSKFQTIL